MASAVAPGLQHHLVAAQARGQGLHAALTAALDACGIAAAGPTAALRRMLLARPNTPALLAAAANASGQPCAAGALLARLLSSSLVGAGELLAAADPAELALAVAQLHAAAGCPALPAPAAAAAKAAFVTLIKLLATSSDGAEQQRAAERVMAHLRQTWLAPAAGAVQGGMVPPGSDSSGSDGPSLLAAAVDAVDAEVFPRHLAHSWLAAELGHVLRSGAAAQQQQPPQPQQGAASADAGPGGSWAEAMAAFAAALPSDALLEQAQAVAWQGDLHPRRAAALLAAAAQQCKAAGPQVEQWVAAQAAAALAQHAAAPLRALLLLQRELLLLWHRSAAGSAGASDAQQGGQQQQQQLQQQQQQLQQQQQQAQRQQQQQAQQAYKQWFAAALVAPGQHPHLQFLVQQVLIPLVPEETGGCGWLQAQADVLAGLLRVAQQPGAAPLPHGAAGAANEYLEAAKQRLRAELAAAVADGGGQAAAGGPAAPLTNLQKGQALVAAMLREYEDCGGQLRSGTLNQMQAKASNVFTRGELHNMLLPALLSPTSDEVEAARRAALMQYLYQELGCRGDSQIRPHLKPEALALFRQRCRQAQLESASLHQLVERAPQLLTAGGLGATAAEQPAGGAGGSGGGGGATGGLSSHQVLDKLGRLVGEELQAWHNHQQQQRRRPGSSRRDAAAPASSPDDLATVLLDVWTAAYCSGGGGGGGSVTAGPSGPSPAAVAAHLLAIAHAQPQLHAPLLRCLRQRLLASSKEPAAAEQAAQHAPQRELEATAMLASLAGALVQRQGAGSMGSMHAAAATAGGGPDALQPLYVWQQDLSRAPAAAAVAAAAAAAPAGGVALPGPAWLQQLLLDLPLSSAAAMARSARVAAAHLGCLRHFRQHCLLPAGGHVGSSGTAGTLRWQQAAAAAGGYDGEFVARLVCPACTASLRLLQWLRLRLSLGSVVLPMNLAASSSGGAGWDGAGPPAKRQRGAAGAAADAASGCEVVLGMCGSALRSEPGASLAAAAGGLPLADYLRLEAAAGSAASTDLLPPGAAEAALRLCCALYLQPGSGDCELDSLVQPLAAVAAAGGGGSAAGGYVEEGDVLTIPDSDDEDARMPAAGGASSGSRGSAVEGLGAAAAAALAGAAEQHEASVLTATATVCQHACAHCLRLLAAPAGSPGLPALLAQLLASAVQHSRQQLAVQAVAPSGQRRLGGQWQQAAVQLRLHDPQQAARIQQAVAALASGLALELLPVLLTSSGTLEVQQRRLAAVAEAVRWALSDAGLGSLPAVVQERLAAALEAS